MAYQRNGGTKTARSESDRDGSKKDPPVFTRKLWTPSGTLELAVFEKQVQGERKAHTNFFVSLTRSYQDPKTEGEYVTTTLLNPQDLLMAADLYRIAWDFILNESNRN